MKGRAIWPLAVFAIWVAMMVGSSHLGCGAVDHGPIPWMSSLQKAQETAAAEGKPVFVDFYADWCGPCREMLATTYKDPRVVSLASRFVPVLVNVDENQKLAAKYGVQAIPTTVFMDGRGTVLTTLVGYHGPDDFLAVAGRILGEARPQSL